MKALKSLIDLIYPPMSYLPGVPAGSGYLAGRSGPSFCQACFNDFTVIESPICSLCGRPFSDGQSGIVFVKIASGRGHPMASHGPLTFTTGLDDGDPRAEIRSEKFTLPIPWGPPCLLCTSLDRRTEGIFDHARAPSSTAPAVQGLQTRACFLQSVWHRKQVLTWISVSQKNAIHEVSDRAEQ